MLPGRRRLTGPPLDCQTTIVSLLDGGNSIALHRAHDDKTEVMEDGDEDCFIDMSRCEQLMGKKPQLYGCGLCVAWLLEAGRRYSDVGLRDLLHKMDATIDEHGMISGLLGLSDNPSSSAGSLNAYDSASWRLLVESLGCAYRPRRFEAGQALTRLRGVQLDELPVAPDEAEIAARAEEERKKQELLELWNSRRKKGLQ